MMSAAILKHKHETLSQIKLQCLYLHLPALLITVIRKGKINNTWLFFLSLRHVNIMSLDKQKDTFLEPLIMQRIVYIKEFILLSEISRHCRTVHHGTAAASGAIKRLI